MPKLDITSQERSALRAAAHPLRPVVLIGDRGLTDSVLSEIDMNLSAHTLIKVRVGSTERDARDAMLETICEALSCAPVHHLGKTLVIYRPGKQPAIAPAELIQTRARRKPSEPHTPKKLAAAGVTRTRRTEKAERAARRALRVKTDALAAPRERQLARAAERERPAHRIVRRPGSALSLRSGSRRTLGPRGPKR